MTTVSLSLLGPIAGAVNGRSLALSSSRAQALLAYLAMNQEYPQRREALMELLWPGLPPQSAQVNLRRALYLLRQALNNADESTADDLLLADRHTIQLNPEADITLDVHRFSSLLRGSPSQEQLEDAIALYRGDFLCDFYLADSAPFEEWTASLRADLRRQALEAYDRLVSLLMGQAEFESAQTYVQQQLALDPLHERGHRHLMQILVRLGQRSQALAQYDELCRLLKQELDAEPSPKTRALAEQIRQAELGTALQPSGRVRGYELKEQLGAGAFGVVYRGVQPVVGREVAIKIIAPEHANRPDFIRRFEAEARIVARLEHPYIVPLYDYWREPDGAYLVMRYLRGGSLRELLREGPCDLEQAVAILDQVTAALAVAHRRGIVHRDIKPANILLDEEGNAYLTDFGIAKELQRDVQLTQEEMMIGSPAYLAPEQVLGEPVTPQSDLYSLGVVLYEMLTGAHPFADTPLTGMLAKHASEPLPSTTSSRDDLPSAADAIIQQATAKTPAGRYPDARALALALHALVDGTAVAPPRVDGTALINPYKGLRPFEEADAADFFGRESLVAQLLSKMKEDEPDSRFLAVVGPSGSGKSSVVKAGLLPALRQGALPGAEEWFVVQLAPGVRPLDKLEVGLLRIAARQPSGLSEQLRRDAHGLVRAAQLVLPDEDATLLLVVDQLEELFAGDNPDEQDHFLKLVAAAVTAPDSPLRIVTTLRADFYDRPLLHAEFGQLIKERTAVVLPMTTAELTAAVAEPARQAGAVLEEGLAATIVADVAEEAGALPMLQYALTELFARRDGQVLTRAAYETIGGVAGALAKRAEEVFAELDAAAQGTARQLFLRLVTLGEGVEDTRRRALRSELEAIQADAAGSSVAGIIDTCGQARLLTFDHDPETREPTVEVAHEALLREWPRLRTWLDDSRDDVRLQRLLSGYAAEWAAAERAGGYLLRGSRLDQFLGWMDETTIGLTADERAFLEASLAARQQREAAEEARRQRELETAQQLADTERRRAAEQTRAAESLRRRAVFLGLAMVMAVLLAIVAFSASRQATLNAEEAAANLELAVTREADALTQQTLAEAESERADEERETALAAQALAEAESDRADEEREAALAAQALAEEARLDAEAQAQIAFSRELASTAMNNLDLNAERSALLALYALETTYTRQAEDALHAALPHLRTEHVLVGHEAEIGGMVYSPDGSRLVTTSADSTARVWDTRTGEQLLLLDGHEVQVNGLAYSPDGDFIVTSSWDSVVKVWDAATGAERLTFLGHYGKPNLDAPNFTNWVPSIAVSPDSQVVATGDSSRTIMLWDPTTGEEIKTITFPEGPPGTIRLTFTPDGQRLIAGAAAWSYDWQDSLIRIIDIDSGAELLTLPAMNIFALSRDGSRLLTSNYFTAEPGTALWDLETGTEIARYFLHDHRNLDFSPDGMLFATGSFDGRTYLWETATGQRVMTLSGHQRLTNHVRFSPDGMHLAAASNDYTVRIWDIGPSREIATLQPFLTAANVNPLDPYAQFNPDGTLEMAAADWDESGAVALSRWDPVNGTHLLELVGHVAPIRDMSFSPDGSLLATNATNDTIKVWDTNSGDLVTTVSGQPMSDVRFSPDGATFATRSVTGDERHLLVFDAISGELLQDMPMGNKADPDEGLRDMAYSPSGSLLATLYASTVGGGNPYVEMWDLKTGNQLWSTTEILGSNRLRFTLDSSHLFVGAVEGSLMKWDAQTGELIWQIRAHTAGITGLAISPDGKIVATTSWDNTIRLWDTQTGDHLLTFEGHTGLTFSPTFSPDGSRLASSSLDGTVRLWAVTLDELVSLAESRVTRALTEEECQIYLHMETCPAE